MRSRLGWKNTHLSVEYTGTFAVRLYGPSSAACGTGDTYNPLFQTICSTQRVNAGLTVRMPVMIKLAFSYAHADEQLRDALQKHLASLQREGLISSWHDRRIRAGEDFAQEIDRHFEEAHIILLLISPDFIASDYCHEIEMRQALRRHAEKTAIVIPVILRPCHWEKLAFGHLLAVPQDGKPITKFASLDDGFYDVVGAIRKAVKDFLGPQSSGSPEQQLERPASSPQRRASSPVRSSNYGLKRSFSELDRDNTLQECFTYLAEFFENSLLTLEQRYSHLTCSFQRVDAKSLECAIYENGQRRVQCGIWIEHSFGDPSILYSSSGITRGSYNESASAANDGTNLGFKLLGMATYLQQRSGLLTSQGVAES
ncbi:MAG: toll/interleukin-1 receptor domain-containing protein, partial [Nitrospiraceae bacterium]